MTVYLKQSTASQEVPLGYFLDSTDGNTAEDGLSIANTDIKIWKAGATTLANKNSGGATHISGGIYYAVLDATDTDTLGSLVIFVHVAGALSVRLECCVLAANVYDSLIGGGDLLQVDVQQFGNSNLTSAAGIPEVKVASIANGAIVEATFANNAITDAKVASDVTIASVTGAVGSVTGAVGSVTGNVGGNVAGSVASVTGNVGGNVVGTVASVVGNVGGNVVGNVTGSVGSLAAQAKADVNAEVLDVMNVDTHAEPGQGAPAATTTIFAKINYLYKLFRNKKTQSATTFQLWNDAETVVDQKSTISKSGGTVTRGEIVSGP